jgi:hypothetical protein
MLVVRMSRYIDARSLCGDIKKEMSLLQSDTNALHVPVNEMFYSSNVEDVMKIRDGPYSHGLTVQNFRSSLQKCTPPLIFVTAHAMFRV